MKKSSVQFLFNQVFFRFVFASFILLFAQNAFANFADRKVNGRVTDATTGNALSGAIITIKGTTANNVTDAKGDFSVTVANDNSILVVSFLGYTTQEVFVGNKSTVNIQLQSSVNDLAQVVVVGYGSQNKKDVTGSVKSIKAESFNRGIINNPQQLIQGKVAGVNVTSASGEPGATLGITVRGPGGVRTGSTPLFVVDGIPLEK
jgi:iron complex outermembrane receptor protein